MPDSPWNTASCSAAEKLVLPLLQIADLALFMKQK
jgi:hypothetical protein